MMKELQICLGYVTRRNDGKKVDVRGFSGKELEYFKKNFTGEATLRSFIATMAQPTTKGACHTAARREVLFQKARELDIPLEDLPGVKATAEKHFLGVALSCSAADMADDSLASHTCLAAAREANGIQITMCCVIDSVRHTKTKRGKNPGSAMCFLVLADSTYSYDQVVVFPDAYERLKNNCKEDLLVLVTGDKRDGSFLVQDIQVLI
jgi:DNA polymerase III alpha subunit